MTERPSRSTNKTFEGICLALSGKFRQKEWWILFVFKTILKTIKFGFKLIYEQFREIK